MHLEPKEVVLNALAGLRPARNLLRRVRDQRRPVNYDRIVDYSLDRLSVRRRFIGDDRIRNASLLEIGSGPEFCVALLLIAVGARRLVNVEIDGYRYIRDARLYRMLVDKGAERGLELSWPPAGLLVDPDGATVRPDPERIVLYLGRSAESIPEPDGSVDLSFSIAVLEHIWREAMLPVAREIHRLTAPDGVGYHRIDLVDHYNRRTDPFRFLHLNDAEYRLMFGRRGSSSNRLRIDDYERIFHEAGFREVGFEDIRSCPDDRDFAESLARFHAEFQGRDREMLRALECMLVIRR